MKIISLTGKTVATVTPEGEWTWVARKLAPRSFAALVDQPEIEQRMGQEIDGKFVTQLVIHQRGTPGWVGAIHERFMFGAGDLQWVD